MDELLSKKMRFRAGLIAVIILMSCVQVVAQSPTLPSTVNLREKEKSIIEDMIVNGTAIENDRLVCWFPKDSLDMDRMGEISDMLLQGLLDAEELIKAPLKWQEFESSTKIHFFFPASRFVSYASPSNAFVFIPFWRIQRNKAPWLHETLHIVLRSNLGSYYDQDSDENRKWWKKIPNWLIEGLPTYLSNEISKKASYSDFDPHSSSYDPDYDILVKKHHEKGEANKVLDFIGEPGYSKLLNGKERNRYAPMFYHGSASFVSYIAKNHGIDILIEAIGSVYHEHEVIELKTGQTMEQLKQKWMESLGI